MAADGIALDARVRESIPEEVPSTLPAGEAAMGRALSTPIEPKEKQDARSWLERIAPRPPRMPWEPRRLEPCRPGEAPDVYSMIGPHLCIR